MTLAVQLLAVAGIGLALLLMVILLHWIRTYILKACCRRRTPPDDHPIEVVVTPRCMCSDLKISGVVARVEDGDGFVFLPWCPIHPNRQEIKVRLAGIDAPEMPKPAKGEPGQPFAPEATNFLRALLNLGNKLEIDKYGKDQYGRVLAIALVPQEGSPPLNVNIEMVRAGLAEVYKGRGCRYGDFGPDLGELEEEAKTAKRGFWSRMDLPDFETPSHYKRRMRARQNLQQLAYRPRHPRVFRQRRITQEQCILS